MLLLATAIASDSVPEWETDWILARMTDHGDMDDCETPPEALQKRLAETLTFGESIRARDRAAWLSTDELRAAGVPMGELRGWLTAAANPERVEVHWIGDGPDGPVTLYYGELVNDTMVWPDPSRHPNYPPVPEPLSRELAERWACRQGAVGDLGGSLPRYSPRPNFVVTPTKDAVWVWVIPEVKDDDGWIFGGVTIRSCDSAGVVSNLPLSTLTLRIPEGSEEKPFIRQRGTLDIPLPFWPIQVHYSGVPLTLRTGRTLWVLDEAGAHWLGAIPEKRRRSEKETRRRVKARAKRLK